jgi:hypothetical protein
VVERARSTIPYQEPTRGETSMGFFSKILDKLGLGSAEAAPVPTAAPAPMEAAPAGEAPAQAATPAAGAMSSVDVAALLEGLAAANPQKLNWRPSIVDLLKLLNLDSSLAVRKELAEELGCPADLMGDSAAMNTWLHKTVLRKLAENGGQIPPELLD